MEPFRKVHARVHWVCVGQKAKFANGSSARRPSLQMVLSSTYASRLGALCGACSCAASSVGLSAAEPLPRVCSAGLQAQQSKPAPTKAGECTIEWDGTLQQSKSAPTTVGGCTIEWDGTLQLDARMMEVYVAACQIFVSNVEGLKSTALAIDQQKASEVLRAAANLKGPVKTRQSAVDNLVCCAKALLDLSPAAGVPQVNAKDTVRQLVVDLINLVDGREVELKDLPYGVACHTLCRFLAAKPKKGRPSKEKENPAQETLEADRTLPDSLRAAGSSKWKMCLICAWDPSKSLDSTQEEIFHRTWQSLTALACEPGCPGNHSFTMSTRKDTSPMTFGAAVESLVLRIRALRRSDKLRSVLAPIELGQAVVDLVALVDPMLKVALSDVVRELEYYLDAVLGAKKSARGPEEKQGTGATSRLETRIFNRQQTTAESARTAKTSVVEWNDALPLDERMRSVYQQAGANFSAYPKFLNKLAAGLRDPTVVRQRIDELLSAAAKLKAPVKTLQSAVDNLRCAVALLLCEPAEVPKDKAQETVRQLMAYLITLVDGRPVKLEDMSYEEACDTFCSISEIKPPKKVPAAVTLKTAANELVRIRQFLTVAKGTSPARVTAAILACQSTATLVKSIDPSNAEDFFHFRSYNSETAQLPIYDADAARNVADDVEQCLSKVDAKFGGSSQRQTQASESTLPQDSLRAAGSSAWMTYPISAWDPTKPLDRRQRTIFHKACASNSEYPGKHCLTMSTREDTSPMTLGAAVDYLVLWIRALQQVAKLEPAVATIELGRAVADLLALVNPENKAALSAVNEETFEYYLDAVLAAASEATGTTETCTSSKKTRTTKTGGTTRRTIFNALKTAAQVFRGALPSVAV